ncbi:hypothetical protein BpHYR1_034388 [Brachionus plicatilis]|uniref:Uncharacterized protein n=1 Tax=Brachionus plicatilis TaxID=10195 RepID=A0A3M7SVQ6_BRAPC|nr:hypothetical protein BpHYR1_034388 [Brachionus plicatilis]
MTSSFNYRQEGNKIFQSINSILRPLIFVSRLNEAQKLYNHALAEARDNVDFSSACKNLFIVSYKFQKFYSTREFNVQKIDFYCEMAQKYASDALEYGINEQSYEWLAKIKLNAKEAFSFYYESILSQSYEKRIKALIKVLKSSTKEICALIQYRICECYFRLSGQLMNSNFVEKALATNYECDYHYEESLKFSKDNYKMTQTLEELKNDYILQRFTLEGLKSKNIGHNLLHDCINNHEDLNLEQIWDIVDWFRDAIDKLKGKDVESEAELSSDIAYVYDEILKIKDKAKSYYQLSWHLADSLRPKIFTRLKWYQRCAQAIERYQQEKLEQERQSYEAQREQVFGQIKDDIEKLRNKAKDGYYDFLPFIYSNYPPKNPKHTFSGNLNPTNLKKSIQTAIYHYHPDKNSSALYGNAWFFTADEITKILTNFYEKLKDT